MLYFNGIMLDTVSYEGLFCYRQEHGQADYRVCVDLSWSFWFFLKKLLLSVIVWPSQEDLPASCCEMTSSNNRPNPRIPCQKSFSPRSRPVNSPGLERGCAQVPLKKINTSIQSLVMANSGFNSCLKTKRCCFLEGRTKRRRDETEKKEKKNFFNEAWLSN